MQSKCLVLLLLLGFTACLTHGHFTTGSDFESDEKERYGSCKPLVSWEGCGCSSSSSEESSEPTVGPGSPEESGSTPSGSGSGEWSTTPSSSGSGSGSGGHGQWGDGDYCFLFQFFLNISISWEVEIRTIFVEWINVTQVEIVENSKLTEYEILVEIWYSLQILFEKHVEIRGLLEFQYITGWGYVCELEGLALDIQTVNTEITIEEVITIVSGTCPLFEALEKCGQNGTADQQDAIEAFIQKLTVIINAGYSFQETLVKIYLEFEIFFEANADLKVVIFETEIEEFGIIQSFFDICNVYWRIQYFSVAVGGSTDSCELIQALTAVWQNTSLNTTTRSNVKELTEKLTTYYESEVSVELRIQYFAEQLYQFFILYEWEVSTIWSIQIEGYGSCYDLIYAWIYCQNNGVGPGDFTGGPSTTEAATTPTSTTTTSTTTTSTTTSTTPTTTTKPNGDCSTVTSVNVVTANITLLLSSIDESQSTQTSSTQWTTSRKSSFLGYKKRIYNLSINTTITATDKFNAIKTVLTGFTSDSSFKSYVWSIFIDTWGTIGQYCGCTL